MRIFLLCCSCLWSLHAADGLSVVASGKPVPDGSTYHQPMNKSASSVALFSEQRDLFTIRNTGAAPVVIHGISLTEGEGVVDEEFTLQDTALKPAPLTLADHQLAPDATFDFYVRFYPVHSGQRTATVTIAHGDGAEYSFALSGSGRTDATFLAAADTTWQRIYGGAETDEQATGMAADGQGNVYMVGQVAEVADSFAYDLLLAKADASGNLLWSRLWHGPYRDYSRDTGQNDQTGGSADAIAVDAAGNLYLAGAVSRSSGNNDYAAFVLKVASDGRIAWERQWRPAWPSSLLAKHGAQAYALAVRDGRVYVTGSTGAGRSGAESHIFVLALAADSGELAWQRALDPSPGSNDRGYAIAVGTEQLYLGGSANNRAFLARLDGLDDPQVAWIERVDAGMGSSINALDLDSAGDLHAAVDVRGMNCTFSLLKVAPDGSLRWGRTYAGGRANQNNNTHLVRTVGEDVIVGGRIAMAWMDMQMGDGFLMRLGPDGELRWSAYYYTGKGPDEIQETRVKGVAVDGDTLLCFGQLYTGNNNGTRYHGYWYGGTGELEPYAPGVSPIALEDAQFFAIEGGAVIDAAEASPEREWIEAPQALTWQDPVNKLDGEAPDEDWFLMRLDF